MKSLQEEIVILSNQNNENHDTNKTCDENANLKDECSRLQSKVSELESDISRYSSEHAELSSDHKTLKESYSRLNIMKERMESLGSGYWKAEMKKVTEDYELCQRQVNVYHRKKAVS